MTGRSQVLEYSDGTFHIEVDGIAHPVAYANVNAAIVVARTLKGKREPVKVALVWDSNTDS